MDARLMNKSKRDKINYNLALRILDPRLFSNMLWSKAMKKIKRDRIRRVGSMLVRKNPM
jgi:hypothetical protein